jgi:hypothetical protein
MVLSITASNKVQRIWVTFESEIFLNFCMLYLIRITVFYVFYNIYECWYQYYFMCMFLVFFYYYYYLPYSKDLSWWDTHIFFKMFYQRAKTLFSILCTLGRFLKPTLLPRGTKEACEFTMLHVYPLIWKSRQTFF